MKKFWYNLTIKRKLQLTAIGFTVFLLMIAGLSYFFLLRIKSYNDLLILAERLNYHSTQLRKTEKAFLFNDLNSPLFYKSNQSEALDQMTLHRQAVNLYLDSLRYNSYLDDAITQARLDSLNKTFNIYNQVFEELLVLARARGAQGQGEIGEVDRLGQDLQDKLISMVEKDSLIQIFNRLLIAEKNYRLFHDKRYRQNIDTLANLLGEQIKNYNQAFEDSLQTDSLPYEPLTLGQQSLLTDALNAYHTAIKDLISSDLAIGTTANEGKIAQVETIMENVEDEVNQLVLGVEYLNSQKRHRALLWLLILIGFLTLIFLIDLFFITRSIFQPLDAFKQHLQDLGRGELPANFEHDSKDEIAEMGQAVNRLTENLRNVKQFVTEVGKGNLNTEVNVFDNKGDLGGSLIGMRTELRKLAQEQENQEQDARKRNWHTQGLARFSDILRQNSETIEEIAYNVLKELVDYLEAVQGALFVLNNDKEDDLFLELVAAYAYNRQKQMHKRIELGEGLAGRCAQEGSTVYLTELPDGHFEISSGLGLSSPRSLLVVPLMLNEELFGVIEMASYKEMADYYIEFAEHIAETVSSAIANVKINNRTARLLEETRLQAEELTSKEEEMRQNMEELQATQEEAARKEQEATGFVNSVNHTIIRADYTKEGLLEYANTKFSDIMGYRFRDIKGAHYSMFLEEKDLLDFDQQWQRIITGGRHIEEEMRYKTKTGKHWFLATYTPIKDIEGNVLRILYLAIDIHESKTRNLDYAGEIEAIERSVIKVEYQSDGSIIEASDMFMEALGYRAHDLKNMTVFNLIKPDDLADFEHTWRRIKEGIPWEDAAVLMNKAGEETWMQGAYSAVKDFDNHVYKVIYIAYDITQQKQMEIETRRQADILREQEERLKANMEAMKQVQKDMEKKQKLLETVNKKMLSTENTLKKALEKAKLAQQEADEKNEVLKSQEAILRENMEKMQKVQKEMAEKDAEMSGQLAAINKTNAVAQYDMEGNLLEANDLFCELFNYVESDIIGRHHRMFLLPEDRKSEDYTDFWNDLRHGIFREGEFKHQSKDGRIIFLKAVYNPILDENGQTHKVLQLAFDMTGNKQKEAEIRGQLDAIDKSSIVVEYNLDGIITHVNSIFCDLFDYKKNEITGRHHRVLLSDEEKNNNKLDDLWLTLRNGHYVETVSQHIKKDGTAIFLKTLMYPMVDQSDNIYKVISLSFDLTEIKEAEEKLRDQAEELMSSEEEMRQNLEELQATQESMDSKQRALETANRKMKTTEDVLKKALQDSKKQTEDFLVKEKELIKRITELEKLLKEKNEEIKRLKK